MVVKQKAVIIEYHLAFQNLKVVFFLSIIIKGRSIAKPVANKTLSAPEGQIPLEADNIYYIPFISVTLLRGAYDSSRGTA